MNPGIKDYTRIWILPQPIMVNGLWRQVILGGMAGQMIFMNTDENVNKSQIFAYKPNGNRPTPWGTPCADASSSVLIVQTGEIAILGKSQLISFDFAVRFRRQTVFCFFAQ